MRSYQIVIEGTTRVYVVRVKLHHLPWILLKSREKIPGTKKRNLQERKLAQNGTKNRTIEYPKFHRQYISLWGTKPWKILELRDALTEDERKRVLFVWESRSLTHTARATRLIREKERERGKNEWMILSAVALFSCAHNRGSPRSANRADRTEPDTHSSFFSSVLSSVSSFLYGDPKKSREKMVSASTKNDLILRYTRWSNVSVRGREIAPRWIFVFCVVYIPSETGSRLRSL